MSWPWTAVLFTFASLVAGLQMCTTRPGLFVEKGSC
jgi:hypothetical protein